MTNITEMMDEVETLKERIIAFCHPVKIILFGSVASGVIHKNSDIDLCIVADYTDKRAMLTNLYVELDSTVDLDLVLYRPDEWEKNCVESTSFAYLIHKKGTVLYG